MSDSPATDISKTLVRSHNSSPAKTLKELSSTDHLVVLGINYHSSPLAIRERFTIPESCLQHALTALKQMAHVKEAVVLSTCNRTEVYATVTEVQAGLQEIESFFITTQTIADHQVLRPNFKLLRDDAALHLFRVASGLDSMVLGEGQIMSQVKSAYQAARDAGTARTVLDKLFKLALSCGKRVRSETTVGRRAVSISSASVEMARGLLGPLGEKTILVVGAGKMAQICLKHLLNDPGDGPVIVINRRKQRIEELLKNNFSNRSRLQTDVRFEDRYKLAAAADLVLVATSAPRYLFETAELDASIGGNKLHIIDISVPRNVDPKVACLRNVKLYNTDDLSRIVTANMAEREAIAAQAEEIVFQTLDELHCWQRSLLVVPTIAGLRDKIEEIRLQQIERRSSGTDSTNIHDQLEEISHSIVKQILHHPTVQLKATRDYEILRQQAEALRTLFSLDAIEQTCKNRSGDQKQPSVHASSDKPACQHSASLRS